MKNYLPMVYCICGPTASGKSGLAVNFAKEINAEVVSADSMQIYKHMDIGTAKITPSSADNILHHMIDIIEPIENYSVAQYAKDATLEINKILEKGKPVILCGGTGQYINALLDGLVFIDIPTNDQLRAAIEQDITIQNLSIWHERLNVLDPESGNRIASTDIRRIRRFFEVYQLTNLTQSEVNRKSKEKGPDFQFISYYLKPDREILYERINQRVVEMFKEGLESEVKMLLNLYPGIENSQSFQAIGYKETLSYINHEKSLPDVIETISKVTRHYAKRQFTWFNARTDLITLENLVLEENLLEILNNIC